MAIGVIILVAILIVTKLIYNYTTKDIAWEEKDEKTLITNCLDDLSGRAVIYPLESTEYCSCTTKIVMKEFTKKEYLLINAGQDESGAQRMTSLLAECNNSYQEAMFNASQID